jgi:amino acid permease
VITVVISLTIAEKIDKFLGLVGALLCAPLAMTIPALVHLKLVSKSKKAILIDILLIAGSVAVLAFSTIQSITTW